jgi:hypothetical protein
LPQAYPHYHIKWVAQTGRNRLKCSKNMEFPHIVLDFNNSGNMITRQMQLSFLHKNK